MNGLVALIIAIVIISAVVGAIAQFLNKLNEMNAPPSARRPPAGGVRQTDRDMDRFLAEIDRLRKKNAEGGQNQDGENAAAPAARPVARPVERPPDRSRPRVVAELAEPQSRPSRREKPDTGFVTPPERREKTDAQGFILPPSLPPSPAVPTSHPTAPKLEELPVATVVTPTAAAGAPPPRLATLPRRPRPVAKTDLAKNLTGLLGSGQGVAMAVILQEVLGPPKARKG